jgi:hypothetical protein
MLIQEEALSNYERQQITDTALAYRQFYARHPEMIDNDYNSGQLCEYFALKDIKIVQLNDSNVPLAVSPEMWEEAYRWKMSMSALQVDPAKMSELQRQEAQRKAKAAIEAELNAPTEDELYNLPMRELEKRARGKE